MNVRLIVPNHHGRCDRNCKVFPCPEPIATYGKAIADIAGGFTATQGIGGWIGPGAPGEPNKLVVEPVTVFDCFIDDSCYLPGPLGKAEDFRNLAKQIASDLHQDCVYLSIDGKVEYVRSDKA